MIASSVDNCPHGQDARLCLSCLTTRRLMPTLRSGVEYKRPVYDPDPLGLLIRFQPKWQRAPHLELLNNKLKEIERGEFNKKGLMVFLPPRHGKSELISRAFPADFMLAHPDRKVILASHEASFAINWARGVRDLIELYGKDYGVELREGVRAARSWQTTAGGEMFATGIGGSPIGRGAHLFIIDDPLKDHVAARSLLIRDKQYDWYQSTFPRLEPGGVMLIVMQRWHEDDIAGRILRHEPNDWEVLRIPAIAEDNDPLGREVGAALWPDRYPIEKLEEIRRTTQWWFWAQYQQRPAPEEGAMFTRSMFRFYTVNGGSYELVQADGSVKKVPIDSGRRFIAYDLAGSEKETADWSVFAVIRVLPDNDMLVEHLIRRRMQAPDALKTMDELNRTYLGGPGYFVAGKKEWGLPINQMAKVRGIAIKALDAKGDKVARAMPLSARMQQGTVYFLDGTNWISEVEDELCQFPNGPHDDIVDALAYGAFEVTKTGGAWTEAYGVIECPKCGFPFFLKDGETVRTNCPKCYAKLEQEAA